MGTSSWMAERWPGFVQPTRLDEYSEKYAEFFAFKRENGILEVRFQTDGGPYVHSWAAHSAWNLLWQDIGNDDENEVLILTGTGDRWFTAPNSAGEYHKPWSEEDPEYVYKMMYDGQKNIEAFVNAIEIPTIGAINGPGVHWEHALFCDITLAVEDADFLDPHFLIGVPPGDGMGLVLQHLMGTKRAAHHLYTSGPMPASKALELGMVNEVLPRDQLDARAWELAEMIMKRPRNARRLTHAITVRPWRKLVTEDLGYQLAHQFVAELTHKKGIPLDDEWKGAEARKGW